MRKHKPKTLRAVSVAAEMAAVCEAHKRVREFFCVTDSVLICPLCLVSGDQHKDHTVVPMAEQDAKALPELKSALDEAQKSYQGLKKTFEKLVAVSKACENQVKSQVDAVHAHFQHLHCLLELRMHHLLAGIRKVGAEHVQSIQEQLKTVESKIEEFKDVQKDASAAIASSNPEHTSFLLEQMKSFSDMPCFITSDTESYKPVLDVQYEPPLSEVLKSYGKLRFTLPDKLSLVPAKDLPEGCLEEELDNTDADSMCSVETPGAASSVASDETSGPEPYNSKRVKVSHIRDLSCFFVQPTCLDAKLKKLQSEIRDYCRMPDTRPLHEDEVVAGELYLAQYKLDKVWYRCRALRTVASDTTIVDGTNFRQSRLCVEVLYIDYGNSEVVPLGRMRRMSSRFDKLGPVAIKCSLYNVVPVGSSPVWRRESNTVFGKLTHDKKLILREAKRTPDTLVVDLVDDSEGGEVQTSISDALVFLGVASYHMPPLTPPVADAAGAVRRRYYPPVELLAGQVASVIISCIYSPDKVFVQQLGSHAHSLRNLLTELQAHCKKESNELDLVFVPREGLPCLSLFPSDRMWYRARIVGVPSESRVQVVYVDYGNEEMVPARSLRRMPEQFMQLPVQALPVRLADVVAASDDGAWSDAAKERLVEVTSTHRLIMKVHGSSGGSEYTKVALYMPGKNEVDVCINALLVKEGLANSTGPLSLMENVPSLRAQLPPHQRTSLVEAIEETVMISKQHKRLAAATVQSRLPSSNPPKPSSVSGMLATLDAHLTEPPKAAPPPEPDRPKEEYVPVQVTHVESPVKFYVRMLDERKSFEKLHKQLQSAWDDVGGSRGAGDGQVPWVGGQWCAAKLGRQRVRGIVVSVAEEAITVWLVDSGKHADIPVGDLSPLPLELTLTPPFARPCHLADMIPAGGSQRWCKTAEECFVELLSTKNRVFVVHMGEAVDGSLPVDVVIEEVIEPGALEPMRKEYRSARTKLRDMGYGFVLKRSTKEASLKSKCAPPEMETSARGSGIPSLADPKPTVPDSVPDEPAPEPAKEECRVSLQEGAPGGSSTETGDEDDKSEGPNSSPPGGGKVADCEATQPQCTEAVQPQCTEPVQPHSAEAVQLDGTEKVQPKCAGAEQPESAEAVEPENSVAVHGGCAEPVHPQGDHFQVASSAVTEDGEPREVANGTHSFSSEFPAGDGDRNPVDLFVIQEDQGSFMWKPRSFPKEKQMLVMPSHIDEDAVIYAQVLGKDIDLYKTVKEALFEAYDKRPKPVHRALHIGQACIARYSADLKFYRAVILSVAEKGIEVRFVDYGTSEYANPDDIYTDLMFEDLPVLCIEAELYGLKPFSSTNTWPLKTLDGLHYMLVEKRCSLVVKEPPTETTRAQVHLFLPDGVAVHDVLLEMGLAYRLPEAPPVQQQQQENHREEPREQAGVVPDPYREVPLPERGVFPVLVTNLETADVAFVQRCKYAEPSTQEEEAANRRLDEFFAMTEELQEVANQCPPLQDAAVGTPCIGKYSYDQLWYRGLITEHKSKKKVTVFYVDYGNSENLAKSSLRVLPEKLRAVPVQAHKCHFYGVLVKKDPSEATLRLSQILFEKDNTDFLAEIKIEGSSPVEIDLMTSSLELVYAPLVEEGFITIDRGGVDP